MAALQRLRCWLAVVALAVGYVQCPVCNRWRQDPTDYCPGCGL